MLTTPLDFRNPKTVPKDKLKDVEVARRKLLVHAPAVPSPLRRKISSTSLLASQLEGASIGSSPPRPIQAAGEVEGDDKTSVHNDKDDDDALMEAYRQRIGSVLVRRSAAVA